MNRDPETLACVESGATRWDKADPYLSEVKKLDDEAVDIAVLGFFDALIEASEEGPLGEGDYSAPCGRSAVSLNPAWIGEFSRSGAHRTNEGGRREYRLYFGESPDDGHSALAALLGWKTAREMSTTQRGRTESHRRAHSRAHEKQTRQIATAQQIVARWAKVHRFTYRKLQR